MPWPDSWNSSTSCYKDLKAILKNIRNPALLDNHPWTRSLVVQEQLARDPRARLARPGQQLIHAIASLFTDMQPATPPRRGKRLDPRWGEFGLLAALYFIPFRRGTPFPTSLLEAWRRIGPAILEYVYGKPVGMLTREEVQRYQLVGEEVDYGSASTLSDWHRKGVQRLADILANRERFLSSSSSSPALITDQTIPPAVLPKPVGNHGRFLWAAAGLLLVVLILSGRLEKPGCLPGR